jgi:hypothetical protein
MILAESTFEEGVVLPGFEAAEGAATKGAASVLHMALHSSSSRTRKSQRARLIFALSR